MLGEMRETEQLAGLDAADSTPESICAAVANIFHVRETEVGLLELSGRLLNFLYPAELKMAGAIPLSSSAVAARTAQTKHAELFNDFTQVKHFSIFELVKLGDTGLDDQVIQKLMSAPVLAENGAGFPDRLRVEEPQSREPLRHGGCSQLSLAEQIRLVLANVLRSELIRRATKVTRKIFDRLDVAVDGSLSVITTLEFFEHHFAKVGHRLAPYDPTLFAQRHTADTDTRKRLPLRLRSNGLRGSWPIDTDKSASVYRIMSVPVG